MNAKRKLDDSSHDPKRPKLSDDAKPKFSTSSKLLQNTADATLQHQIALALENRFSLDTATEEQLNFAKLLERFTPDQLNRYEHFRRSHFSKSKIKKIVQEKCGIEVPRIISIVIASIVKVCLGQLIESARDIMIEDGITDTNVPIKPEHIREAYRRALLNGTISYKSTNQKSPWN